MKSTIVICSCMLFCCSAGLAGFSGSDDFNDNSIDTNKWAVYEGILTETNNRLEYVSAGVEVEAGIWLWTLNNGSYDQDWTVRMDAHNSITPSASGQYGEACIMVLNSIDYDDFFDIDLEVEGSTPYILESGWGTNNVDGIWNEVSIGSNTDASLQISFDSTTKTLLSSYDAGSGYTTLNSVNVTSWGIDPDEGFTLGIICESEGIVVSSGQVFADNVEAVTLPGISNHLGFVEIDYQYKGNYHFSFGTYTDLSVTNMHLQCPGGRNFDLSYYSEEGGRSWETNEYSGSDFFSQFGDGDYVITLTYSNGVTQSTIIPYAQADQITAIPPITKLPAFLVPAPLHGTTLSCTDPVYLVWTNIDSSANAIEIELFNQTTDEWDMYYYTDTVNHPYQHFFSGSGPLSTRSLDSRYLCPGDWEIELEANYDVFEMNSDGILYGISKRGESRYNFTVVDDHPDIDGDSIPNCWEIRYFGGPTNCAWDAICSNGLNTMLEAYVAGLDPTDPTSAFMITNCAPVGSDFLIEWSPSVSGRVYSTLWTDNLTNDFQTLESFILYPRNSCTDTVHGATAGGFYQVEVDLQ